MNCNTTHYRANSSSVPGDPTSNHQRYLPEALSEATEYPIGVEFDLQFESFGALVRTLPNDALRIDIADGMFTRSETVPIQVVLVRPGVFLVSWVESTGTTVVQLQDFAQGCLYAHATLRDGTFLRMASAITFVCPEETA